ncbi:MAG: aldo/keto reductase [archaeon]
MEYKKISDLKLPSIGIGTWGMGGWLEKDTSYDSECVYAIKTAIKLGMTHIDTAEVYANGHAEEIVSKAIAGMQRNKLFITTKVYRNHLHYNDVISAAKRSLRRLKTDYIDLYLIHWPNPKVPLKETIRAMDYLIGAGVVKNIGVSNFSLKLLKEAQSYTKNKIVANQVEYSLLKRNAGEKLLEYCKQNDIFLIAYQPLAGGKLAKKGYKLLDEMAKKYQKTQAQVAINWLISQDNVITIPKAMTAKHVRENSIAAGWRMKKEDDFKLGKYFIKFHAVSKFIGKPIKLIEEFILSLLPEKAAEKLEKIYCKIIQGLSKTQKKIFSK